MKNLTTCISTIPLLVYSIRLILIKIKLVSFSILVLFGGWMDTVFFGSFITVVGLAVSSSVRIWAASCLGVTVTAPWIIYRRKILLSLLSNYIIVILFFRAVREKKQLTKSKYDVQNFSAYFSFFDR